MGSRLNDKLTCVIFYVHIVGLAYSHDPIGRNAESVKIYDRALKLIPDYADAYVNKGTVLGNLGKYDESLACYDKALELNPDYVSAIYYKGLALGKMKRFAESLGCIEKVLKEDPSNTQILVIKEYLSKQIT